MGMAPPSKLLSATTSPTTASGAGLSPIAVKNKNGRNSEAIVGLMGGSLPNKAFTKTRRRSSHILQQLIVSQDWQRVLIRVRLYPHELSKPIRVTIDASNGSDRANPLDEGVAGNVIHEGAGDGQQLQVKVLPLHVVCALNPPAAVVKLFLELYPDACTVPVLPTLTTSSHQKKLSLRRVLSPRSSLPKKQQHSPRSNNDSINNYNIKPKKQQRRPYWKSPGMKNRFFRKFWDRKPNGKKQKLTKNKEASLFPREIALNEEEFCCLLGKPEDISVYYSAEQDCEGDDDDGNFINLFDRDDHDHGDEDEGSSLSSKSWNEKDKGVILQLSPSGNVTPLPLSRTNETESTTNTTASSAASVFRVRWDMAPLLEARGGGLLALHLACLYRASTEIVQLLLKAFPIAALSDVIGMLPIHWVSAGWYSPQPLLRAPPIPLPELEAAAAELMPNANKADPFEMLRLLKEAIPETVRVQSGNHNMTPDQYVQECMEDGPYKEKCLELLLEGAAEDDNISLSTTTSGSLLFVDSISDTGGSGCLYNADVKNKSNANMSALIAKQDWEAVLALTEDDQSAASKWLYGIDEDKTMVAPLVWKRLPIHLACVKKAPVGVLQVLLQAYPEGAATQDPHSGCLPLHIVCQIGDASCLPAVRFLLAACPTATKAVEMRGRLPLHLAVLSMAPFSVVELLVEHDPQSATIADAQGKTSVEYALQTYGRQHMVTELLSMVFDFDKNQSSDALIDA